MAEFQKVIQGPDSPVQARQLTQGNTSSLTTDLVNLAGAGLQLYGQVQGMQANEQAQKAATASKQAHGRGYTLSQRDAGTLSQLEGAKLDLKHRSVFTSAVQRLQGEELQGYLQGMEAFGITNPLKVEIEHAKAAKVKQREARASLVSEGWALVRAQAADSSPAMQKMYEKYAEGGYSEDELADLATMSTALGDIAKRRSAEMAAENTALGQKVTALKTETSAAVNKYILTDQSKLQVTTKLLAAAVQTASDTDVVLLKDELKQQLIQSSKEFQNFLGSMTNEQMGVVEVQSYINTYNSAQAQITNLVNSIDPVKTSSDLITLGMNSTMAGWVAQGSPTQQETGASYLMGLNPNSDVAQMAIQSSISGVGPTPKFAQIHQRLTDLAGGKLDTQDPAYAGSVKLLRISDAPLTDKAVAIAESVAQADSKPLPAVQAVKDILDMQEQIAKDPEAKKAFTDYLTEKGVSPWDNMRYQHASVINKMLWPTIKQYGFEQGEIEFVVQNGAIQVKYAPAAKATAQGSLMFDPKAEAQRKAKPNLNKAARFLNQMSSTASGLGGFPLNDALQMYAQTLNEFMAQSKPKPVEEETDGKK